MFGSWLDCYTKAVLNRSQNRRPGTVCAGGRYDGLIEQLGEPPPWFAMGIERIILLVQQAEPQLRNTTSFLFHCS